MLKQELISINEHSRWLPVNLYVCSLVCWTKANSTLRKRVGNPYRILNLRLFWEISRRSIKVTLFSENHFKILLDYLPNCFHFCPFHSTCFFILSLLKSCTYMHKNCSLLLNYCYFIAKKIIENKPILYIIIY